MPFSGELSQTLFERIFIERIFMSSYVTYKLEKSTLETAKGGREGGSGMRIEKNWLFGTMFPIQVMGTLKTQTSTVHNIFM